MASLNIRGVPDALVKALKREALDQGLTLRSYVLRKLGATAVAKAHVSGTCVHGERLGVYCTFVLQRPGVPVVQLPAI